MTKRKDPADILPRGRPSEYQPEFCDALIADAKEGLSLTAFAGGLGVARSTLNEWMARHPEFSEAVKRHAAIRTRFLEIGLLSGESGPKVTSRIFALKNAAPAEWKDKVVNEHSGPEGGAIPVRFDLAGLSDEELDLLERVRGRLAVAEPDQGGESPPGS